MKTLKSFEFKSLADRKTYDWDTILSGKIIQLEAGKDFECKPVTMATLCRSAARRRNLIVRTNVLKDGEGDAATVTGLVVQASPASKEQIKAWEEADARKEAEEAEEAGE